MNTQLQNNLPLWQVTQYWLSATGSKVNEKFCREEMTTHPDYPALTAVTDFLDAGNMPYNPVQADASYINEFTYPLLAHIRKPGNEYLHIINAPADWDVQKDTTQHWSGVVLYGDEHALWKHAENDTAIAAAKRNRLINSMLVLAGLAIYSFVLLNNFSFPILFFGLLSLAGLVISVFITGTELGVQNSMVKQVCGAVSTNGCTALLKSKYSKGLAGFTTGDISVLYFSTQFLLFCMSALFPAAFTIVTWIALAGVFIAAWSLYAQAVILKKWCVLCLGVVGVLLMQAAIAAWYLLQNKLFFIADAGAVIAFPVVLALLALLYYPVKQMLITNYTNKQKLVELKKWKMDGELFIAQLNKEQQVDYQIWENDLLLGNPEAPLRITVACNPYCGPCAGAHKQLDHLLIKYKDKICVQIRFICNPLNEMDFLNTAVEAILRQSIALRDSEKFSMALNDWFELMNYEKWSLKWNVDEEICVQNSMIAHKDWMFKNSIVFTPTLFLNGKKIPSKYTLTDLDIIMPQLVN